VIGKPADDGREGTHVEELRIKVVHVVFRAEISRADADG
jgi:hypothetical protein